MEAQRFKSVLSIGWWRTAHVFVQVVLLSASWQGPLPWVHSHADLESHASTHAFFHEHLERFHGHSAEDGGASWHFHLVMPPDLPWSGLPSSRDSGGSAPWDEVELASFAMASASPSRVISASPSSPFDGVAPPARSADRFMADSECRLSLGVLECPVSNLHPRCRTMVALC